MRGPYRLGWRYCATCQVWVNTKALIHSCGRMFRRHRRNKW